MSSGNVKGNFKIWGIFKQNFIEHEMSGDLPDTSVRPLLLQDSFEKYFDSIITNKLSLNIKYDISVQIFLCTVSV